MDTQPRLLPSLDALTDAAALAPVVGRADAVRVTPLDGVGYSNASLARVEVEVGGARHSFVLKRARLDQDWTARRTGDARGREALLLTEPALAPVWEVFDCPYVALATGAGEVGLLLRDLTAALLPDVRAPLSVEQEGALLGALARLHARFWQADLGALDWLVRPGQYCEMLARAVAADPAAMAVLSPVLRADVPRGWAAAQARLTPAVMRELTRPGLEWERLWGDLPRTLLHGDVKVANFALFGDGRVAAFDWACAGFGPCGIDLGWYLAVNATRLTRPKEQVMGAYRGLLEAALGSGLPDPLWRRLEEVAVVSGARMLLWSKALALERGRPGAHEEWAWWAGRLSELSHC